MTGSGVRAVSHVARRLICKAGSVLAALWVPASEFHLTGPLSPFKATSSLSSSCWPRTYNLVPDSLNLAEILLL